MRTGLDSRYDLVRPADRAPEPHRVTAAQPTVHRRWSLRSVASAKLLASDGLTGRVVGVAGAEVTSTTTRLLASLPRGVSQRRPCRCCGDPECEPGPIWHDHNPHAAGAQGVERRRTRCLTSGRLRCCARAEFTKSGSPYRHRASCCSKRSPTAIPNGYVLSTATSSTTPPPVATTRSCCAQAPKSLPPLRSTGRSTSKRLRHCISGPRIRYGPTGLSTQTPAHCAGGAGSPLVEQLRLVRMLDYAGCTSWVQLPVSPAWAEPVHNDETARRC